MANKNNEKEIYCSFCGKPQELVGRLIAGNGVYICDQCVDLCMNILEQTEELENTAVDAELAKKDDTVSIPKLLKPKEIKEILDEYVSVRMPQKLRSVLLFITTTRECFQTKPMLIFQKVMFFCSVRQA